MAQLVAAVRAGDCEPGSRLPGDRRLAARLGVHRNTIAAVYADLERLGLLLRRPGRGTYVRSFLSGPAGSGAGDLYLSERFGAWLAAERQHGTTARELDRLLARWSARSDEPRVVVLEPETALRSLIAAEVSRALPHVSVTGQIGVDPRGQPTGGCCIVIRPDVAACRPVFDPAVVDLVVIRSPRFDRLRRQVRALEPGEVVAFLTVSRSLRLHLRDLLAPELGDRIGFTTPAPDRHHEVGRGLRVASLVLADFACVGALHRASRVLPRTGRTPVAVVRVTCPEWLGDLGRYLDCRTRRDATRNLKAHEA